MSTLLSLKFWFNIYPSVLSPLSIKLYIITIALLVFFALFLKFLTMKTKERMYRRLYRKISTLALTNTFILLVLFFLMYEAIPFLASRFWFLVLVLINLVWLYFIFKFFKQIPELINKETKEKEYKKYIP